LREHDVTTVPEPGTRTTTITEESVDYRLDEGDHERFAHFVPRDKMVEAMVEGTPVRALCGKLWVPSRDPQRFPVCPECKEIWDQMRDDSDGQDG
jgi:Protein of unknown function (DUF3039)